MKKTTKILNFAFLTIMVCGCGGGGGSNGDGTLTKWPQELTEIMNLYYGQVIPVAPFTDALTYENNDALKTIMITDLVPVKVADYGAKLANAGYSLDTTLSGFEGVPTALDFRVYLKSLGASYTLSVSLSQLMGDILTINTALIPIGISNSISQPSVSQPSVSQPSVSQPSVSQPPVSQPPVSQPPVSQSSTSQIPTSQFPTSQFTGVSIDFSGIAKDADLSDTVIDDWVIKASKFSYAGALKLQYAGNHIISPTIMKNGAIAVKLNIFTTGDYPSPWELKIIGLNDAGGEVEAKTIAFGDLPNTAENASIKTWTFTNSGNSIRNIKVIYTQKGVGSNIGIIGAEIV